MLTMSTREKVSLSAFALALAAAYYGGRAMNATEAYERSTASAQTASDQATETAIDRAARADVLALDARQALATVKGACPVIAGHLGELAEVEVAPTTLASRAGLELRFVVPRDFAGLPEGRPRVLAAEQHCAFLVDQGRRLVETSKAACDLVCTGTLPEHRADAAYAHAF